MFAPNARIYPFFYNRVFNGASFSSDRTILKEDRIRHFAPMVPSFLRQIRCPCLRSRMRSVRRRISLSILPPRKFFNLRILNFPRMKSFILQALSRYLLGEVCDRVFGKLHIFFLSSRRMIHHCHFKASILYLRLKRIQKSSRHSVFFFHFCDSSSISIKLNENGRQMSYYFIL